jgi:hypothetical protein
MRWAKIIGILLISLSGAASAQSIDQGVRGLETCFESARLADSICEKQTDPEQRLNCFEKTRAAQLECLKHVLPDRSASSPEEAPPAAPPSASLQAPLPASSPSASLQAPLPASPPSASSAAPLPASAPSASSEAPLPASSPSASSEAPLPASSPSASSQAPLPASAPSASSEMPLPASPPSASLEAPLPASPPSASSQAPQEVTPKEFLSTNRSNVATEQNSKDNSPKADVRVNAPETAATREEPTATIQSDAKSMARPAAPPLMKRDWIISETTSPIDFSALAIAVIQPVQQMSNGPISLVIRCRAKSTELALQFPSEVNVPKAGELQLDYQIDEQPSVRQRWTWPAGGKIAVYKGDPVPLLQSIPEGARLMIRASGGDDTQQAATFLLIGLDSVRKRVGTACRWAPLQAGSSAPKR